MFTLSVLVVASMTLRPGALKPDLVVSAASAVQTCVGQTRSYDIRVIVANHGGAPSPARLDFPVVAVGDGSRPAKWTATAGLPAIAVNGSATVLLRLAPAQPGIVSVPIVPLIVTVNSGHWIDESNFDNDGAQIASVTSGGCAAITSATLGIKATKINVNPGVHLPPNGIVLLATPRPPLRPRPMPPNFIAPPTGLTYTTDPTVCVNHVGLLGAFVCEQAISQAGLLLLVWSWSPCSNANCVQQIQGYHIYAAPPPPQLKNLKYTPVHVTTPTAPHSPSSQIHITPIAVQNLANQTRTPLDTQTDPTVTMRGITPYHEGECLVVTAYANGKESDDSNTFCIGQAAFITAPWNVRYIQNYATCGDVFGSTGYQQCASYLSENHLVLYWNWNPCPASSGCAQSVDGYNIDQTGGTFVAQQRNAAILAADAGPFQVGACYTVRAYRGNVQSDPSWPFCVAQQMVPTPQPAPTPTGAPMHVDIDVPDDTFPSNVIIHVGGSVTWKNEDTDEHNVVSADSEIVGDLPPGGSFTYTFTRVAVISYHCDFHQGMQGTITVVAH